MRVKVSTPEGAKVDDFELPENVEEFFRLALTHAESTEPFEARLDRVVESSQRDDSYGKVVDGDEIVFLAEAALVFRTIKEGLRRRSSLSLIEGERIEFV
jgi:hypothetical protein